MKEINVYDLSFNPMGMVGHEWMLITAGNEQAGYNTMTASWGHLGSIWGRKGHGNLPTAVIYVRPQRYTKAFVDREELFTLTVFGPEYREALGYLGSHSGRDGDKVAAAGLTPVFIDGTTGFAQARLTLVCRKLYHAPLKEGGFVDQEILDVNYPQRDLHELYVGEIIKAYVNE